MDRVTSNLQITVVGAAVLLVVGAALWFGLPRSGVSEVSMAVRGEATTTAGFGLTVHVSGEVVDPGLVTVPDGSRVADAVAAAGGATRVADLGGLNLAATVADGDHLLVPAVGETDGGGGSPGPGIDLNRASASELEALPGVGPVLAERIVAFREEHGRFEMVEDLLEVPGIGEAKLASLREAVTSP